MHEDGATPRTRHVTVLGEPGCPLCAQAGEILQRLAPALGVTVRRVELAPESQQWERYRYVAPVICADGVPVLSGRIEERELREELERVFGSDAPPEVPPDEGKFLRLLECPICEGKLEGRPRAVACLRCGREYARHGGVLLLVDTPEPEGPPGFLDRIGAAIGFKLEGQR